MAIGQFISSGTGFEFKVITDTSGNELDLSSALTGNDVPSTILVTTTYFDAQFRISGNNVATYTGVTKVATDGTLTDATKIEEVEAKTVTTYSGADVVSSIETGFIKDSSNVTVKEWTYNFDANGEITSGTETEGTLVRTLTTNWAVVSEKGSVAGLTAIDTTGIPTDALASTGAVFKTTDGVETIYYDANGDITGYSVQSGNSTTYFDADYDWVGDVFEDSRSIEAIEVRAGVNGAYSEVGSFTLNDGSYARSWTFNFDDSGSFTGGSETENGITKTYNSSWQVTSSIAEVGSLTALTSAEVGELSVFGFASDDSGYKSASGVQTTYYSDGGVIVGYTETQTGSGSSSTLYFDEDYAWLGETRTEGTKTWTEFVTRDATAGTLTVAGSEAEGGVTLREWKYIHNESTGDLIEGYEIQNDIRIEFGANWVVTSETFTGTTSTITDAVELALIPDTLKFDASGTTTASYSVITNPWGTETVYFDGAGAVLGRSFEDSGPAGETFTSFNADDGQYLGSIFELGTRKEVRFESRDDQTLQTTETGAEYEAGSSTPVRTWTYVFDDTYNLVSGTETEGGVTKTFGANWELTSTAISSISALTATTDVDLIPLSFVIDGTAYYLEKDYGNNTERTFYNPEDSSLIGYSNTFTDTLRGSVNTFFEDADREWIGDYQNNNGFEFAFFNIENDDGTYTEYGFESGDGFDRSWEIQKSSTGQIIGGYQIENGITVIFDEFGNIASKTVSVDNLQEVTNNLYDLPVDWILTKDDSSEYALRQVKSSSWGDEATYFDASGNILGVARSWSDSWGDITAKGISFEDANFNYLGDVYIEDNGTQTRKYVRFESQNETNQKTSKGLSFDRQETGYEYTDGVLDRSWDFKFDLLGKLVEGNETVGGVTTIFGPGWVIEGTEVSVENITTTLISAEEARFLPSAFVDVVNDGSTTTYTTYTVTKNYDWGGSETIYFDAASGSPSILGYENSWSDPSWGASGSGFEDANRNWLGDVYNDGQALRYNFFYTDTVGGTVIRFEAGGEYAVTDGVVADTAERSYSFQFDDVTGDLISGSESYGGSTTIYGANWSIEGQSKDNFNVNDFLLTADQEPLIVFLPDDFISEDTDGLVYTYAEEQRMSQSDSFITFYDENGSALGYANMHQEMGSFWIGLNDLEWNFLGNISSFDDKVEVRQEKLIGGEIVESGSEYSYVNETVDIESPIRSWEYRFEPTTYNFLGGTETSSGVTTTYGANWVVTGKSVSASNIVDTQVSEFDASLLPSSFVINIGTSDAPDYHVYTSTQNYDWGGSETIYFSSNTEGATILGYENTWSWSDYGRTETGSSFENANRVYLGDTYDNGDWVNARFETSTLTSRTEKGVEYEYNTDGTLNQVAVREWEFVFEGNNLSSGTETFDGATTVYGENWTIVSSQKANFVASDLRTTVAQDPYIALLPDQLKVLELGIEVIYSETKQTSWGDEETSYYDASGNLLGYGFGWNDASSGAGGGNFNTADWKPLGDYYDDGTSFAQVRTQTYDEVTNRITETGSEFGYVAGTLDITNPVREFSNIYDGNWNFISGSETVAGVTTTFGANRSVTSKTFDTSKIVETSITENDAKLLPDSFVIKTGPADALVYTTYSVSSSSGDNTNVTYFDSDASDAVLIGTANTWTNSWTDPGSTYSPADTGMTIPPVSEPITGSPSEPYPTSPSATTYSETGTEFLDANNNFIGNVFNDGSYVNANFSFFDADGSRHEKGGEYQIISNAIDFSSPIREYEYNYGSNGKLVDGVRIEDGLTTEYGPEFSVQSVIDTGFADRKASIKKYEADDPLLDAYAEIGSNLIAGTDGGGAYIYKEYDLSSADPQFKLYSETGSIIARVHENIWTDYNSGQTITNYHLNDANYNFIGRIEDRGDTVRIENYTETATTKTWSGSTFVVNSGVLDTSSTGILEQFARTELLDGTFVSETRTEGGVITTFDKYGGEVSTTFANLPTLVAKTEADFEFLPEIFISSSAVYAHEVVGDYGSKKIYFFDDAQGSNQLGSADYYTHTGPKPEGGTETYENYYFYDSQGNNVGQTSISSDYKYFSANYDLGGYEIVTESSVADWGTYERYEQFYSSGPNAGLLYEGYEINGNLKTNYGFDYELINTEFYGTFDPGAMGLLELSEPSLTLDVAPVSGQLLLNEIPVLVGETVTYSDLANGALKYHPGSSAAPGDTNITATFLDADGVTTNQLTFGIPVDDPLKIDVFETQTFSGLSDGDAITITSLPDPRSGVLQLLTNYGLEDIVIDDDLIIGEDTIIFTPSIDAIGTTPILGYSYDDGGTPASGSVGLPVIFDPIELSPSSIGWLNPLEYFPQSMINTEGAYDYILATSPALNTYASEEQFQQTIYASKDHPTLSEGSLIGEVHTRYFNSGLSTGTHVWFQDADKDFLGMFETTPTRERSEYVRDDGTVLEKEIRWVDETRNEIEFEKELIWSDNSFNTIVSGYKVENGVRKIFNPDGSVVSVLEDASQAMLFDDPAVLSFMPSTFLLNGGVEAYVIMLDNLDVTPPTPQTVNMKFYDPISGVDPIYLGEGVLTFGQQISSMNEVGMVPMKFTAVGLDGAEFGTGEFMVLSVNGETYYKYVTSYEETVAGARTFTSSETLMNSDEAVIDQQVFIYTYDTSDPDLLVSTRVTKNGKTTIKFEDGSETITNSAPVITVTADTAGEIAEGLAGAVDVNPDTKLLDLSNFWQLGVVSVSDTDDDLVSLSLLGAEGTRILNYAEMPEATTYFGGDATTSVEVEMAQNEWGYGILLFDPATGKYAYNFSDAYTYYNADHADEAFIVSSSDEYHNVFQSLDFELLNANNPAYWKLIESSEPGWNSSDPLGTVSENATGHNAIVTGNFTIRNGEVYSEQDISIGYYDKIWNDTDGRYERGSEFTKVLDVDEGVGDWSAPAILEYGSIRFKITDVVQVTNDTTWSTNYSGEFEYTYDTTRMSASEHWQFDEGDERFDWGYVVLKDGQFENNLHSQFEITGENYPPIVTLDDGTPPPAGSSIYGSRFDGGVITHNVEENQNNYEIWFNVTDKPPSAGEGDRKLVLTGTDKDKFVVVDGSGTTINGSSTASESVYLLTDTSQLGFKLKFASTVDLDFETAADNQLDVDLAYYDEDGASVATKLLVNIIDDPDEYVPPTNTAPQTDNFTINAVIEDGLEIQFANYSQMTSAVPYNDAEDPGNPTGPNFPSNFVIKSLPASALGTLEYKGNPVDITSGDYQLPGHDLTVLKFVPSSGLFFGNQTQLTTTFEFAVQDSNGAESGIKTATIVLTNNAPSLDSAPSDVSVSEDASIFLSANDFGQAAFNDGERIGAQLTNIQDFGIQLLAGPSNGVLEYGGAVIPSGDYPVDLTQAEISSLKFIPTSGESGDDYATLRFKVSDGYSYSPEYSLNIDVIAGNQAPTSDDVAVSTITTQSYYFDETDFPFSDDITSTIQGVKIISAAGDGVFSLNNVPYTDPFPLDLKYDQLSNKAFSFYSDTAGTATITFEVFDGSKFSSPHTLTVTAADNTAPVVTPQTLSNLELGSETSITDWGFNDPDGHGLGRIEFTGGDLSWVKYDGSSTWSGHYFNTGDLNLLTIKTPYTGGSKQFTYIAYDQFGAASAETTFTLTAETPTAIGALDGNEAVARIGGDNYFDTSGSLLDLLDISNVANGIDVSQYEGGILNITPVAMYSQTETVQLGLDVAQSNPGQFAGGYIEMMLDYGGLFKLYEDLSYEMSVSTYGGLIAGDTADIFVTFAKDGEDTVQGQINVEYIDPAPVNDADLNQAFSEDLYNGQSQVISSGQLDLEGQTSIEIYHVESDYSHTFDLLDSWQPWPYTITGTHGALAINKDGSYQYYYQEPAAGVLSGSVTDTFDITVDAASDAADFNSAVPRTGTMTFTANHVAVPVTPPQQQQVFDIAIDDLNGDDLRVDYGNGQTPDTFDITVDPHDPGVLEFSKVTLQQSFVSDLISGLSNNSALDLEFKIDQMPAGAGTAYIELFVHDKGNGDFNDDHPGERSIGMIFEVEYDQYGMTIPTQTGIQVEYFGANATTPLTFSVDNLDPDTISLSNGTNSTPGSLNLKLGSILAKLDDSGAYSSSLLSDAGSYMVEISATTSLSGETATNLPLVYGAGNPVHEIRGEVEIVAGGSPVFTVITDDAESADLIINAGNGNQRSIDLYIDPSDSEVLKFSRVTLNDQFVKDQIDGLASNSALDLSFKLGALPTSGTGSAFIELTVQDKGNGNMSVESGERAISMVFEVDYDRDSISIPQQSGVEVSYKGAYGGIATFYVDNLDADTINLVQGTNSTPNSLNLKLGSILEKLDGSAVYSSSLLSDPGNYIVSLSGKSQIDGGVDVDLPIVDSYGNKIKSIVGEVEIIDPPSNVEFHYGGSSSNVTALTTTEDPFGKVTFDEFGVHDYVFTNYSLEPSIKFDLADAIDTNGGSWAEKVAVRIHYDDNNNGNLDNGEAWVEALFEVERSGDGTTESISTGGTGKPADDITISYGNQVGAEGPIDLATITLSNDSVDVFSITEGLRAGTPDTMNVRLDAILDEFSSLGGATVPLPQGGDNLEISISLLLENENEQEILDGSISII